MTETEVDVAILGGAFSGAATGLLIRRRCPGARVLIVEKAEEFDRKVGESTTEVSSTFLTRVLGLTQHLGQEHLAKQGLRFWFSKDADDALDQCVEMGGRNNARLPGFQVDREVLDEHVLEQAVRGGCELLRPAKVTAADVEAKSVRVRCGDEERLIRARWIIDASGRVALLSRQLGLFRKNEEHPVNALWARFRKVKDWDGPEMRERYPAWADAVRTGRTWATNHLMGYGWWCWIIPLKGGDTSIGLVYDSRLYVPPAGATIAERLRAHFQTHAVGREILSEVEVVCGDERAYGNLAYWSEEIAGDGWAIVGDAAAFIDPLYSSGLDFCAFTASAVADLVHRSLEGGEVSGRVADLNAQFRHCYHSWFAGIYRDKYHYLGDADLWAAAFLMDVSSYHLGPVRQVVSAPANSFHQFPFAGVSGQLARRALEFYNQRLVRLAKRKRAAGVYGQRNAGWRLLLAGFLPDSSAARILFRGMRYWLRAEWQNLFLPAEREPIVSPSARTASIS